VTPIIDEMERVIRELPVVERPVAQELERGGLFAPDALTNPAYAQFALKVTLAAMLCYVFYTAGDWTGIHTCMTTCAIVALGSAGATIHKATLRLVGCAIGGLLALVAIVFLLPKMTSIVSLAFLAAAVTAPVAWIAMGSERTAYLGVQLGFTFYLATLQDFGPSADVTEFRDRFVGVVVGVIVMSAVFAFVWPERADIGARRSLAAALRRMARLAQGPADFRVERAAAWQSLDEVDRLDRLSEFEPTAVTAEGLEQNRRIRSSSELAQSALIALGVLAERRGIRQAAGVVGETNPAMAIFTISIGSVLSGIADHIESDAALSHVDLRVPRAALRRAPGGASADDDVALSEIVADRVEALQRAALAGT
jgi:multidrug resistance protein MdtO